MTSKTALIRGASGTLSPAAQRGLFQLPRRLEFLLASMPPAPAHVLDVGCAGGYVSVLLQRSGYEVTGIELNEAMAAQARERGVRVLEHDLEEPVPLATARWTECTPARSLSICSTPRVSWWTSPGCCGPVGCWWSARRT